MNFYKKGMLFLGILGMCAPTLFGASLKGISENNSILVPLRVISEELGAKVTYDGGAKNISIQYGEQTVNLKIGSKTAMINGQMQTLQLEPRISNSTTYVPVRFIGEALGGTVNYASGQLTMTLGEKAKNWQIDTQVVANSSAVSKVPTSNTNAFQSFNQTVNGKKITGVKINMNDSKVKTTIQTAGGKISRATDLKTMANDAKVGVNGTYFAAYNGATPYPDGTIVKNGKVLHITDIGSTIGFTSDNKVIIDFVTTRVQGYINGAEAWTSYRVNRPTSDPSAVILYTPEYEKNVSIPSGRVGIVCIDGKINKIATADRTVPANGFILVVNSNKKSNYQIGDEISYKVTYSPKNTSASEWEKVTYALSAGPSLMINSETTGNPANEAFTEAKILNQSAARTFIGVDDKGILTIATTTATISELKNIVKQMGLVSAMCLDGGASSGLVYNGSYLTTPGRKINNCICFYYE